MDYIPPNEYDLLGPVLTFLKRAAAPLLPCGEFRHPQLVEGLLGVDQIYNLNASVKMTDPEKKLMDQLLALSTLRSVPMPFAHFSMRILPKWGHIRKVLKSESDCSLPDRLSASQALV